jgi:phosphatidylinositol 3-kinase
VSYILSSDLKYPLKLKIASIEGNLEKLFGSLTRHEWISATKLATDYNSKDNVRDIFVTVALWDEHEPKQLSMPSNTGFGSVMSAHQYRWDDVQTLPVTWAELTRRSVLQLVVWDVDGPGQARPCGVARLPLFGQSGRLKKGRQKLAVDIHSNEFSVSEELFRHYSTLIDHVPRHWERPDKDREPTLEIDRIEKLIKKHQRGNIPRVEWLDRLAFRSIERINEATDLIAAHDDRVHLFIDLPDFEWPVLFHEQHRGTIPRPLSGGGEWVPVLDPEISSGNPVEQKHSQLSRRRPTSAMDHDLKPNKEEDLALKRIIAYSPIKEMDANEKEFVWKFRFFLRRNKKALTKFLKCVEWTKPDWTNDEALQLMRQWDPIDLEDSLELLSFRFRQVPEIRSYAVERLKAASDEELLTYLLQLVQVLRYDKAHGTSVLGRYLIDQALANHVIANYLYWYLKVELNDEDYKQFFQQLLDEFMTALEQVPGGRKQLQYFEKQEKLTVGLNEICLFAKKSTFNRPKRMEKIKEMIRSGHLDQYLSFQSMPLPIDPEITVTELKPDVYIFKSAMAPIKIDFQTTTDAYSLIFKVGDDLRQDQLVVQLISLMDRLLKKENLDLRLTPYKVLATHLEQGMLELVKDAKNIADVLEGYDNDIKKFLRDENPDPSGPYGMKAEVLDTFIKSCAGYCVVTYILGIGDRHLDNLLITKDGRLFHIDFGFILGRDPKPLPPPMKLCTEMVEGMGGQNSAHYSQFKFYCCEAYNILRKSAHLILNLFSLMIDAHIRDINQGEKSVLKVQEKFKLDLTDEEAMQVFQTLIADSVRALFPQITETMHRWKKYWQS